MDEYSVNMVSPPLGASGYSPANSTIPVNIDSNINFIDPSNINTAMHAINSYNRPAIRKTGGHRGVLKTLEQIIAPQLQAVAAPVIRPSRTFYVVPTPVMGMQSVNIINSGE
jgi:hypothetical protein